MYKSIYLKNGGNISMNLVNKKVMHKTFGKGNVINYSDSYIKINFKSGEKRFVFPDAFKKYITFIDQQATNLVDEKIEKKLEKRRKAELKLETEKALEEEQQQYLLDQKAFLKGGKVHAKIQSVFSCEAGEEDEIFTEWKVFTGEIKSGKNKGEPRKLARMNQNSACLFTRRDDNMAEEDRQILGVFMADELFDGRECEDGFIIAHPKYRIRLSEKESEKILFWNYYFDEKDYSKTVWNSGKQRYFDNIIMAQILKDIAMLIEDPQEKEEAQTFFEHFCKVNFINHVELTNPEGALMRVLNEEQ